MCGKNEKEPETSTGSPQNFPGMKIHIFPKEFPPGRSKCPLALFIIPSFQNAGETATTSRME
jgi:hypothetical protein